MAAGRQRMTRRKYPGAEIRTRTLGAKMDRLATWPQWRMLSTRMEFHDGMASEEAKEMEETHIGWEIEKRDGAK